MNRKLFIPTILFIFALILSLFFLIKQKESAVRNRIILFYGEGCPHCAIVEKYIEENKIKEKFSFEEKEKISSGGKEKIFFEEKEVYYNRKNAKELAKRAKICGIPENSIGVPFLWNGSKCFIGDQSIIEFFKQKNN